MKLRPRQAQFVDRSLEALEKYGNTLAVGPTGFGKTIALSATVARIQARRPGKHLVLQHRDELVEQNSGKFLQVNPGASIDLFTQDRKSWLGDTTFAMVQSLSQPKRLETMPFLQSISVDETHHIVAPSYQVIIDRARQLNPDLWLYGVTATTERGDGKRYNGTFDNVADQVTFAELILSGHLVRPRTYAIDAANTARELMKLRGTLSDMDAAADIMNKRVVHEEVIRHWREKAGDRCTIVFCSNVEHAEETLDAFRAAGVSAGVVHSKMSKGQRRETLASFNRGEMQVLVNVGVLTEGFDYPPCSCVVLLRPSSHKGLFIQMVGRGLRIVDPDEFPGVVKTDCVILDFGTSAERHGTLEEDVRLFEKERHESLDGMDAFFCPNCLGEIPATSEACPLCGHEIEVQRKEIQDSLGLEPDEISSVMLREINLLDKSAYSYIDLFGDDQSFFVNGFTAWAGAFCLNGIWYSVGAVQNKIEPRILHVGERYTAMSACDDFMNLYEDEPASKKNKRWKTLPATSKQLNMLGKSPLEMGLTRDHAAALITFKFSKRAIQGLIYHHENGKPTY